MKDYSKENLDVTHYRNGDSIPFVKSKKEWSKLTTGAWCYYDNNPENGILYNWHAVNDSRGLAPEGWKIPTIEELEHIDLTTGLPGGYRSFNGYYGDIGNYGGWWSSAEDNTDFVWSRYMRDSNNDAISYSSSKRVGLSVRCIKDEVIINKSENMKDYSKENLDVTHYRNGDDIPFVEDNEEWSKLTTGAYCYYDNNSENGILYNGYAVNDRRGLAPEGWKIPTIEELEQIDLTTGLPGGFRSGLGYYSSIGCNGYWWSSTENDTYYAWIRNLVSSYGSAFRSSYNKKYGLSVRCLRDVIIINKSENMEVVIDGIVYVPKELEKEVEPIIVEQNYKFEVHPDSSTNKLQWDDAVAYAKSLGNDWRLPTIEECFIMYNNEVITTKDAYWSSLEGIDNYAWYFYFNNGSANYYNKCNTYYVRAVRSL